MDSSVVLKEIHVRNLFGKYNYDIDLDNVSILIAPNGFGKTTIFRLIDFALHADSQSFMELLNIPFDGFKCDLSNGQSVTVKRIFPTEPESTPRDEISSESKIIRSNIEKFLVTKGYNFEITIQSYYSFEEQRDTEYLRPTTINFIEELSRRMQRLPDITRRFLLANDENERVSSRYEELRARDVNDRLVDDLISNLEAKLKMYHCYVPITFIRATRLSKMYYDDASISAQRPRGVDYRTLKDPLTDANNDLTDRVKTALNLYNASKASVQNVLPKKFLSVSKKDKSEGYEVFKYKWEKYTSKIKKYYELGFLEIGESSLGDINKADYEEKGKEQFLDTYIELFNGTTEALDNIEKSYSIMQEVFNSRNKITDKKIRFTKDGIKIDLGDGRYLESLDYLSSGEKNDFIMFYNLIFNLRNNSLVLIDEPEISLHIAWQKDYVNKIIDICNENKAQAIIATHSPNIISGHIDILKRIKAEDDNN